jgi:hypothetical protein
MRASRFGLVGALGLVAHRDELLLGPLAQRDVDAERTADLLATRRRRAGDVRDFEVDPQPLCRRRRCRSQTSAIRTRPKAALAPTDTGPAAECSLVRSSIGVWSIAPDDADIQNTSQPLQLSGTHSRSGSDR